MKKKYVKPYIAVESFQLNAAIAGSCSSQDKMPLGFYQDTCTLEEEAPGTGYFGAACATDIVNFEEGGDVNDQICYHGPVSTDMFMNS